MSQVIAEDVTHCYAARKVLDDVSFRISAGDRVGLVGPNVSATSPVGPPQGP